MRILLVDDHSLFRDGLGLLLQRLGPQITLIDASTCDEALAAAAHYCDLDLIILDLALPGKSGLTGLGQLREQAPTVPVVVVSASLKPGDVRAALASGAAGYIPKTLNSQDMLAALRQVMEGDIFVPAGLLAALSGAPDDGSDGTSTPACRLTGRQIDVLRCLVEGMSNKEIAKRLDLTEGTVKLHVSAVMRALGAKNRTEAALAAQRCGMLQ